MRIFILLVLSFTVLTTSKAGLDRDTIDISRDSIVSFAKNYLGLPYKYASRNPARGFDCSGFTMFVFKNFNINLSTSSSAQVFQGEKILLKNAIPGDLVFFRRSRRGRIFHVALVSKVVKDSIFVIHATTHGGIRIDNLATAPFWKTKYKSVRNVLPGNRNYTLPDVEKEIPTDLIAGTEEPPIQERQPIKKTALLPTLAILPKWNTLVISNQ